MAFTTGGLIEAAHYNAIQSTVANVLGTGSGDSGYGQTLVSSQVAAAQLIQDDHLNNLRLDIRKAHLHQNNSYPTLDVVSTANTVDYVNVLNNSWSLFETRANSINANRNTISGSRLTTAGTASSFTRGSAWNGTITGTFTMTCANAAAARHFFNSGGAVQIILSVSGGNAKNDDWNNMFTNNMGTLTFANLASSRSGSGGTLAAIHYTALTTSYQTVYSSTAGGVYSASNFNIQARFSSGSANAIDFQIQLNDAAGVNPLIDEDVQPNLFVTVNRRIANGGLGDPITIAEPTFGGLTGF